MAAMRCCNASEVASKSMNSGEIWGGMNTACLLRYDASAMSVRALLKKSYMPVAGFHDRSYTIRGQIDACIPPRVRTVTTAMTGWYHPGRVEILIQILVRWNCRWCDASFITPVVAHPYVSVDGGHLVHRAVLGHVVGHHRDETYPYDSEALIDATGRTHFLSDATFGDVKPLHKTIWFG